MNPFNFVEGLISEHLKTYIENYDRKQLSIGLWNGQVKLKNIMLKQSNFDVGSRSTISLECAFMESVEVFVPWTQLHSGNVKVTIENVNIVAKLFQLDVRIPKEMLLIKTWELSSFESKMQIVHDGINKKIKSSAKTQGLTTSWLGTIIESLTSSLLSRLVAGFSVLIKNVDISLLIPETNESSEVLVRIHIDTLTVKKNVSASSSRETSPLSSVVLDKDIELIGFSLSLDRIPQCRDPSPKYFTRDTRQNQTANSAGGSDTEASNYATTGTLPTSTRVSGRNLGTSEIAQRSPALYAPLLALSLTQIIPAVNLTVRAKLNRITTANQRSDSVEAGGGSKGLPESSWHTDITGTVGHGNGDGHITVGHITGTVGHDLTVNVSVLDVGVLTSVAETLKKQVCTLKILAFFNFLSINLTHQPFIFSITN